jgi:hypothetical protein
LGVFHSRWRIEFGDGQQVLFADGLAHLAVRVVGAAAHRLVLRVRRHVGTADGGGKDLLDEAGAGAAGAGGLGVLAYLVEREQALRLDRLDDAALADAVAAADFGFVGHGCRMGFAGMADVTHVVLAEHQVVADLVDVLRVLHQLEIPGAVRRVAIEHGADQHVVLQHQFLVHAA